MKKFVLNYAHLLRNKRDMPIHPSQQHRPKLESNQHRTMMTLAMIVMINFPRFRLKKKFQMEELNPQQYPSIRPSSVINRMDYGKRTIRLRQHLHQLRTNEKQHHRQRDQHHRLFRHDHHRYHHQQHDHQCSSLHPFYQHRQ